MTRTTKLIFMACLFGLFVSAFSSQEPYWIGIKDFEYTETTKTAIIRHRMTFTYTVQAKDWATASKVFNRSVHKKMRLEDKRYVYVNDSYDIWEIDFKNAFR